MHQRPNAVATVESALRSGGPMSACSALLRCVAPKSSSSNNHNHHINNHNVTVTSPQKYFWAARGVVPASRRRSHPNSQAAAAASSFLGDGRSRESQAVGGASSAVIGDSQVSNSSSASGSQQFGNEVVFSQAHLQARGTKRRSFGSHVAQDIMSQAIDMLSQKIPDDFGEADDGLVLVPVSAAAGGVVRYALQSFHFVLLHGYLLLQKVTTIIKKTWKMVSHVFFFCRL